MWLGFMLVLVSDILEMELSGVFFIFHLFFNFHLNLNESKPYFNKKNNAMFAYNFKRYLNNII